MLSIEFSLTTWFNLFYCDKQQHTRRPAANRAHQIRHIHKELLKASINTDTLKAKRKFTAFRQNTHRYNKNYSGPLEQRTGGWEIDGPPHFLLTQLCRQKDASEPMVVERETHFKESSKRAAQISAVGKKKKKETRLSCAQWSADLFYLAPQTKSQLYTYGGWGIKRESMDGGREREKGKMSDKLEIAENSLLWLMN